jgi:hypothetical protein
MKPDPCSNSCPYPPHALPLFFFGRSIYSNKAIVPVNRSEFQMMISTVNCFVSHQWWSSPRTVGPVSREVRRDHTSGNAVVGLVMVCRRNSGLWTLIKARTLWIPRYGLMTAAPSPGRERWRGYADTHPLLATFELLKLFIVRWSSKQLLMWTDDASHRRCPSKEAKFAPLFSTLTLQVQKD